MPASRCLGLMLRHQVLVAEELLDSGGSPSQKIALLVASDATSSAQLEFRSNAAYRPRCS